MNGKMGVAISTTGHAHRMGFLETCVAAWRKALPLGSVIVVTVDGTADDTERACDTVDNAGPRGYVGGTTYQVGQPLGGSFDARQGVAVNKNTGLELLMDAGVEHLFLCDDDTWPLSPASLRLHTEFRYPHSMVCWGKSRLGPEAGSDAAWTWPRGVLLYQRRSVIERVGGMDEAMGVGGHEHVEWSRRIHQAGLTDHPFITPFEYALRGGTGAATYWHAEDMRQEGETLDALGRRRKAITTIQKSQQNWGQAERTMVARDGDTSFVPFTAAGNGRASATLCMTSRGAEE